MRTVMARATYFCHALKTRYIVVACLSFVCTIGSDANAAWQRETVDGNALLPQPGSRGTALAFDSLGRPHIAYNDVGGVKYASFDGANWQFQTVGGPARDGIDLSLDANDLPHVSFITADGLGVAHATLVGGNFSVTPVDAVAIIGVTTGTTSLALDSLGRPHLSYSVAFFTPTFQIQEELRYSRFDGSNWTTSVLASQVSTSPKTIGGWSSLELDRSDNPSISFHAVDPVFNESQLMYAESSAGSWVISLVDDLTRTGLSSSLELDSLGHPRIGSMHLSPDQYVRFASRVTGQWQNEDVDGLGDPPNVILGSVSLAIDAEDRSFVSYVLSQSNSTELRVATPGTAGWVIEAVDTNVGNNSLATSALGQICISYLGSDPGGLFLSCQIKEPDVDSDFNDDGLVNCLDIDDLVREIAAGTHGSGFDLTGDQLVNTDDRDQWLVEAGAINLVSGNPYLVGDANLDGFVDGSDFNVWNENKFSAIAAWCRADFSADGFIDGSDFNLWNERKFSSANRFALVPEPTGGLWLCLSLLRSSLVREVQRRRRSFAK